MNIYALAITSGAEPSMATVVILGLVIIFIAFIILIVLIQILGKILALTNKKPTITPVPSTQPSSAQVSSPVPSTAQVQSQNKQQIVAAVSAAIAEDMGTNVSHIKIHSIKRI
jgi:sodium pump decarboxylase gamma subunit